MGKTTEEIEAIRARMLANPQTAGIAHNVQDPNSKRFEEFRKKGNEAMKKKAKERLERQAEVARQAEEMAITLEAIHQVAQDPKDIMKLLMNQAIQDGDNDTAFKISKELAEYDHPKKTRIESVNINKGMGDLSKEELAEIAALEKEFKDDDI